MSRKQNPDALTEDEIAALRSDRTPETIRHFVARQHESVGTRTSAYRKVAAAARAERDALMEIRALEVTRIAMGADADDATRDEARRLERERDDLLAKSRALESRVIALTAAPAMAVHSDD